MSGCLSEDFAAYFGYGRHNGFWLFNSIGDIERLAKEQHIDLSDMTMFYYEVFEKQFDGDGRWSTFEPTAGLSTHVETPGDLLVAGYDVVTFFGNTNPECSPLSCNSLADAIPVNRHCLFETFEHAKKALERSMFDHGEEGPFRILAVHRIGPAVPAVTPV